MVMESICHVEMMLTWYWEEYPWSFENILNPISATASWNKESWWWLPLIPFLSRCLGMKDRDNGYHFFVFFCIVKSINLLRLCIIGNLLKADVHSISYLWVVSTKPIKKSFIYKNKKELVTFAYIICLMLYHSMCFVSPLVF